MTISTLNSLKTTARVAGLLWFLEIVTNSFSLLFVRDRLVNFGNAAEVANNIMTHELLFRAGIFSNLLSQIFFVFVGLTLFSLFKEVNKKLAMALLIFIVMTAALTIINSLTNFGALLVLSQPDFLKVFEQDKLNAFMLMFLKLNNTGQGIVEIFWPPWMFTLGLLLLKSRYLPRVSGILLITASFAFLINTFTALVVPQYYFLEFFRMVITVGGLATLPAMVGLLKGINVRRVESLSL